VTEAAPALLRDIVERLGGLAARRMATRPRTRDGLDRAIQLRDHVQTHLRVRIANLEAPLVVLILGPTGAGKSTLFNTLAGRAASQTGVLRPTTREAIVLVHPGDRAALVGGSLAGADADQRLRLVTDDSILQGVALVDAPDLDSIDHANRQTADHLVEAADLCIFVTTATRYADRVPWDVLGRVRQRGLPLVVVVNRMPPRDEDAAEVLADVTRLFAERDLRPVLDGTDEVVAIAEGGVVQGTESLEPAAIAPIAARLDHLRTDRAARIALAARALEGSLGGLRSLIEAIADDCEREATDVESLRRTANHHFERELIALHTELGRAAFLREEALRQWQSFVGADQMTRYVSQGIGRVRGAIGQLIRPPAAPIAEVRTATTDDLVAVTRIHAAEAARRTATDWADEPAVKDAVEANPSLWAVSADFDDRVRRRLSAWIEGIADEIQATGRPKRLLARSASIGVNALGTGVMLGAFIHTGGLTGAEVGVAAATAFLNQKLLGALFGEAAMTELIASARRRLDQALAATLAEERARFEALVPEPAELVGLASDLRATTEDLGIRRAATAAVTAMSPAEATVPAASATVAPNSEASRIVPR
jgi:hypothetical protein